MEQWQAGKPGMEERRRGVHPWAAGFARPEQAEWLDLWPPSAKGGGRKEEREARRR